MHTIFQTETEYETEILQRNSKLYQQYTQCLITCLCWLLGRMQNKYFVNTLTVLGSTIFGSLNHSVFQVNALSPSPRYYRVACPRPHGTTVVSVPITADLLQFSRCPHPHAALYRGPTYSLYSVHFGDRSSKWCHTYTVPKGKLFKITSKTLVWLHNVGNCKLEEVLVDFWINFGLCLWCFDNVGWASGRASGL